MGVATSKSSALSIFTQLIFEIQLINGGLFSITNFFLPDAMSFALLVLVAFKVSAAANIF